jgi:hypothetical protein
VAVAEKETTSDCKKFPKEQNSTGMQTVSVVGQEHIVEVLQHNGRTPRIVDLLTVFSSKTRLSVKQ